METNALMDFWLGIFATVKERQEQGLPVRYKDVICDDLGLQSRRFNSIPDLVGVDVTEDLVLEFLRQSMIPKEIRHEEDLLRVTMPGERWEIIPGYSRYKVSTKGRVWSSWGGKILKPQLFGKRYPAVLIYDDTGKSRRRYIHRLVAEVFIPNPNGYDSVDHIDEDHFNNNVENLQWMTAEQNLEKYMRSHGYWYKQGGPR